MEFDIVGTGSVLVSLTKAELSAQGLTFETLDYENAATRALVARLLHRAAETTGRCFLHREPLSIDVLPDGNGGCLLLLSQPVLPGGGSCAFAGEDIFALIDAARACRVQHCATGGTLFQKGNTLVLVLLDGTAAQRRILREFLQPLPADALLVARLEESARCLIADDALKVLGGTFA
ncbi:MAG: hypothetical protein IKN72_05530 [Clostridia bacterium]|nr:hypothetical protein [Clostridia bacterium]